MVLILASASPRRHDLLKQAGLAFETKIRPIDETPRAHEEAHSYVQRMALEKAQAVAAEHPTDVVLAADTIVLWNNQIIGKPTDEDSAKEILRKLSGNSHYVLTAVAIVAANKQVNFVEATEVNFKLLSDLQIQAYIDTGEPMDKAGAYGIQGKGAVFVERINGCYNNVVGLPLAKTVDLLHSFGITIWS